MPEVIYTPLAQEDLENIAIYTQENWGTAQREDYLRGLQEAAQTLVNAPKLGRSYQEFAQGLRGFPCNRHIIFFWQLPSGDIEVLRILHERMNFEQNL